MERNYRLVIACPDRVGIVAKVSQFVAGLIMKGATAGVRQLKVTIRYTHPSGAVFERTNDTEWHKVTQ